MTLNLEAKNTHVIFDDYGMMVVKGDERSWRDSIGRTVLAWIAYGMPKELGDAIDSCLSFNQWKKEWILYRHPDETENSSRDHWSYLIMFLKLSEDIHESWFKISFIPQVPRMRGMNLWMKSLTGNKRAEFFYYFWAITGAYIGNWFLWVCRWAGRMSPEFTNRGWLLIGATYLHNRTSWQKLWAWIIFQSIPAYALHNKAWQIFVMRESQSKAKLKRILLKRVGKSNLMLRLLLMSTNNPNSGDNVTQEEIDNYSSHDRISPRCLLR